MCDLETDHFCIFPFVPPPPGYNHALPRQLPASKIKHFASFASLQEMEHGVDDESGGSGPPYGLVDASGVTPTYVGDLPPQCAALNRTNINTQLLTLEAAATGKKEHIYHAAMLDPHTSAELSIDDIVSLCDDLIEAHGSWLPKFH